MNLLFEYALDYYNSPLMKIFGVAFHIVMFFELYRMLRTGAGK